MLFSLLFGLSNAVIDCKFSLVLPYARSKEPTKKQDKVQNNACDQRVTDVLVLDKCVCNKVGKAKDMVVDDYDCTLLPNFNLVAYLARERLLESQ